MKRRLRYALLAVLGIGGVVLLLQCNHEPTYGGKTVREWFDEYYWSGDDEAIEGLRQLGTNALCFLVRECERPINDTPFLRTVVRIRDGILPWDTRHVSPEMQRELAAKTIREIGPSEEYLLPLLTSSLNGTNDLLRRGAVYLLGGVNGDANEVLPYLVKALYPTNARQERFFAAQSLRDLGQRARPALSNLISALEDPSCPTYAIQAVGGFGSDAKEAIPLLQKRLASPRDWERLASAVALCRIDSGQNEAIEMLLSGMNQKTNSSYQREIIIDVKETGSNGVVFIPTLLRIARESGSEQGWAVRALEGIQPESAGQVLQEKLKSDLEGTRLNAAGQLLFYGHTNAQPLSILQNIVTNENSHHRITATLHLRYATNNSGEAIAILRGLLNDSDKQVRDKAAWALKHLEFKTRGTNSSPN